MDFDLTGLKPLDSSQPQGDAAPASAFDTTGLKPLDTGGLKEVEAPRQHVDLGGPDPDGAMAFARIETPNPDAPEETGWIDLGKKLIKHFIPGGFKEMAGGALQYMAENPLDPSGEPGRPMPAPEVQKQADIAKEAKTAVNQPGSPAAIGREIYMAAAEDMKANAPALNEGSLKNYSFQAANSLAQMAPGLLATFATRSPVPMLAALGAQTHTQQYGQARNEDGRSIAQSNMDAAFYSLAETIPEEMPLEVLMKPGKAFMPKLLKTMGAEGLQEIFTQILETGYDKALIHPGMTWGEAFGQVRDAGIVGAFVGGGMAAAQHPFEVRAERKAAAIPVAPGPEQGGAPEIPVGHVEGAAAAPVTITPGDIASPLDTDLIAEGKNIIARNTATKAANDILSANGWPGVGQRVTVDRGDGVTMPGTVRDAFSAEVPELKAQGHGIKIDLDGGQSFEAFADEIKRAGVRIAPEALAPIAGVDDAAQGAAAPAPVQAPPEAPQTVQENGTATPILPAEAPVPVAEGDGSRLAPIDVAHPQHVEQAAARVNTAPSDAQKEAGNYEKGHVRLQGLDIAIENPRGSQRTGSSPEGDWSVTMPAHYGYIKRTTGADGEQVDAYIGPNPESPTAWVIDQKDAETGAFDEHKVMLGFPSKGAALVAYRQAFSDGKGPQRTGAVHEMSVADFKAHLESGDYTKPLAGQKGGNFTTTPGAIRAAHEADVSSLEAEGTNAADPNSPEAHGKRLADVFLKSPNNHAEAQSAFQAIQGVKNPDKTISKFGQQVRAAFTAEVQRRGGAAAATDAPEAERGAKTAAPAVRDLARDDGRYAVASGARLETVSGRQTSPAPKFNDNSPSMRKRSLKAQEEWLRDEAIKEAEQPGSAGRNALPFLRTMQPGNMSMADHGTVNDVLFGDTDGPKDRASWKTDKPPMKPQRPAAPMDTTGLREHKPAPVVKTEGKSETVAKPTAQPSAEKPAPAPATYGAKNTIFTNEERAAAAARIRNRFKNQTNAGLDPAMLADGIQVAGYHIEAGARSFADFAGAMVKELGEAVRPYLKSWYNAVRDYPGINAEGMMPYAEITDEMVASAGKEAGADGVQSDVSSGDEGSEPADVQRTDAQRRDGSAPSGEVSRGAPDVRGPDEKRAEAAERGAEVRRGGERGGETGSGNADRLPAAGGRAGNDGRAGHRGKPDAGVKGENYTIAPGALQEGRGWKQKARDNIRAIELMREITAQARPATKAEQDELARYVGWGGIKGAFPNTEGAFGEGFGEIGKKLQAMLPKAEYKTAQRSIQYAHYTSETIVREMWRAVQRLGFSGGSVFEPGMGVGNFAGMMPPDLAAQTKYSGLELDHTTAQIARLLYPQWGVRQDDFTKAPLPADTYDLVIGNPPFADITIKTDPAYAKHGFLLHDYFFAKSLDAVRPGGLLAFVTSAGTMNKLDTGAREYLADRAELVGAIRLPGDAFERNAGTSVTTDIIFLRKLLPEEKPNDRTWTETGEVTLPDKEGKAKDGQMSRYFLDNPENVLGEQGFFDKLYPGRYGVRAEAGRDFAADLAGAVDGLPQAVMSDWQTPTDRAAVDFGTKEKKEGSFYLKDGQLMQQRSGVGVPVQGRGAGVTGGRTAPEIQRIKGLVPIRDALRAVYDADLREDGTNAAAARDALNKAYDDFTSKYGPINKAEFQFRRPTSIQEESARSAAREEARFNGLPFDEGTFDPSKLIRGGAKLAEIARERKAAREAAAKARLPFDEGTFVPDDQPDIVIDKRPNVGPFMDDPESYRLRSIEKYNDETGVAQKGRVFYENVISKDRDPEINGVGDALLYVLNQRGRLDLAEIAAVAKVTESEAIDQLGDQIFLAPGTQGIWETRESYLSGNVRQKLRDAQAAAEANPAFNRNVAALKDVQPAPLPPSEISASLGMPWIPTDVVETFAVAADGLGLEKAKVKYLPALAQWFVQGDSHSAAATSTWGTSDRSADKLLLDALNRQDPKIYDTFIDGEGKKQQVLNPTATQAVQDKVKEIKAKFADWVYSEPKRTQRLVDLYNENFNNLVVPEYSGTHLTTPGIAMGWKWRPHQTRVIARIIQAGNTYMAHAVGAGKTSAMIASGMELRRLGLVRKPMYAVPNHMLGQFTKEFYEQYPTARIMVADEQRFHTDTRKQFIADVANEDLDAVIITHSAFGMIPVSPAFQDGLIQEQVEQYRELMEEMDKGDPEARITRSRLENAIEKLEQRLGGKNLRTDQTFTFEEMGVDHLFVDEAHLFRKLDFATKMANVKGISPEGSKAAWDLYVKTRYLETKNPGHNLVLASGTPITNTMAELYTVSRYLQPAELAQRGLSHFDAWAAAFGDTAAELEQNAAGGYKPVTRFSKFVNIPELSAMVRQNMDVVTSKQLEQYVTRPAIESGSRQLKIAEKSDALEAYQQGLAKRMQLIEKRKGPPKKGDDIMLTVINDGRHAAIDMRLINPKVKDPGSKLNMMVDALFEEWQATKNQPFHKPKPGGGYEADPFMHGPATQMVFANLGIGDAREFNVHKFIVNDMVRRGVPRDQVAIISDYKTHTQRQRLFNDMNEGKVRILIGSTAKMATGVNAQRRLSAIHNLDPLWYPADDEQRIGRGLRQGNMNPLLKIRDYSTKGTYDSTMWGMMERKARFIQGFFEGDPSIRDMDDLGEASQYEQAKAITTNDPRLITLTELRQDLEKERRRQSAFEREQYAVAERVRYAEDEQERGEVRLAAIEQDLEKVQDTTGDLFSATIGGETFDERKAFGEALQARLDAMVAAEIPQKDVKIGTIGGFDLVAGVSQAKWQKDKPWVYDMALKRSGGFFTEVTSLRGMENVLRGMEKEKREQEYRIATAKEDIASFTPKLDKKYEGGPKIKELAQKVANLEAQLAAEAAKAQADMAAADAAAAAAPPAPDADGETRYSSRGDAPDGSPAPSGKPFELTFTEKFNEKRDKVYARMRARLDKYGLTDVGLMVPDHISGANRNAFISGLYSRSMIVVALDSGDRAGILDHESIHALRDWLLFKPEEWKLLEERSRQEWRNRYQIDKRYPNSSEAIKDEEGIAEAFNHYTLLSYTGFPGKIARLFEKVRNAFIAIREAFHGNGLKTPEDVFGPDAREIFSRIESAEIGNRFGGASTRKDKRDSTDFPSADFVRASQTVEPVSFTDKEAEERYQDAKKGIGDGPGFIAEAKEWFQRQAQGFTRHYQNLPNTREYADVHQQLRKLEAAPTAATGEVVRVLEKMVGDLNPAEMDLFTRKVVLDDLAWEAQQDHDLPFGLGAMDIPAELKKVDAALEKRPDLVRKIRERKLAVIDIANKMVAAGVLKAEQIKNPAYYRHQVLDYARAAVKGGGDSRLRKPRWAKRMGSTKDINANMLEAEFDWLHKALVDIETAKTIQWIKDSKLNVRQDVIDAGKAHNAAIFDRMLADDMRDNGFTTGTGRQTSPMNEQAMEFKRGIAMGLGNVRAAIDNGYLDPIPPEFAAAAKAISTENIDESVFPFLAWIMDNDKDGSMGAAQVFKAISGRKQWIKFLLGDRYADTSDIEGLLKRGFGPADGEYVTWQPDEGKLLYTVKTLPEHVMDGYLKQMSKATDAEIAVMMGLKGEAQARDFLASFAGTIRGAAVDALRVGGEKYQLVIPADLAATLNSLRDEQAEGFIQQMFTVPMKYWKQWTLISPRRVLKYNLNNLTGDMDAIIAGSPRIVKRLPQAIKELHAVMRGGAPSERYKEAIARGVFDAGLTLQEIPDINALSQFENLFNKADQSAARRWALNPIAAVWRGLKDYTQFRENWLRYAAYLDYADRIESGETMEKIGYGASRPDLVDAVTDEKDRAGLLARDLVGDYGAVSAYGQGIRRSLIPFYSWMEINTKRYLRLSANAYQQGIGAGLKKQAAIGGVLGVKAAVLGVNTSAYLATRMFAMYGLIQLFNYLFHDDDQQKLDPSEQAQLHVIVGHIGGQVVSLRMQGALSDFLGWIGLQDAVAIASQISKGRADWSDVLIAMAKAPVNKVAGSITPLINTPVTLLSGQKFWPDVFQPRRIRDTWHEAFQTFGLENEYDALADRPSRGYLRSWLNAGVYTKDPGEQAYNRIVGLAHDWESRTKGTSGSSGFTSPRSEALYDWRKALRFGDTAARDDALARMKALGVRPQDRARSLKAMHPLGSLSTGGNGGANQRVQFLRTLSAAEKAQLQEAIAWYRDVFLDNAKAH